MLIQSETPAHVIVRTAYEQFFANKEKAFYVLENPDAIGYVQTLNPQMTFVVAGDADHWLKFKALVRQWKKERGATSAITESVLCPAYQAIIGMGPVAVPFLLAQLRSEGNDPDQWFWALRAITGADPVPENDRGNFAAMADAWFAWASHAGYAW